MIRSKSLRPESVVPATNQPSRTPVFPGKTGTIEPSQLALILDRLPLELTFVDEHGITRWYNEPAERMFMRTPEIIGRPVEDCHPQKSVPAVRKLLDAFTAGTADQAEMWTEIHGKFVHFVYYALRDADGTYRGTLESVQDLTHLRTLAGAKETLDF